MPNNEPPPTPHPPAWPGPSRRAAAAPAAWGDPQGSVGARPQPAAAPTAASCRAGGLPGPAGLGQGQVGRPWARGPGGVWRGLAASQYLREGGQRGAGAGLVTACQEEEKQQVKMQEEPTGRTESLFPVRRVRRWSGIRQSCGAPLLGGCRDQAG